MPDSPTPAADDARPARVQVRRAVVVAAVLAAVVAWIYVLFVYRPTKQIDELTDRRFPEAAERICAATMTQVEALPMAPTAASPEDRGRTVATANDLLSGMADRLGTVAPTGDSKEDLGTREWVDDWRQHVADRRA
ncbi:MAG: hypothetical protein ACKO04_07935 [Actinomycetes bacterium]